MTPVLGAAAAVCLHQLLLLHPGCHCCVEVELARLLSAAAVHHLLLQQCAVAAAAAVGCRLLRNRSKQQQLITQDISISSTHLYQGTQPPNFRGQLQEVLDEPLLYHSQDSLA